MADLALIYKIMAAIWTVATMGLGYMFNDLKSKTKRNEDRADEQDKDIKELSVQVGKLEANTVTKQELTEIVAGIQTQLNTIQITLQKDIKEGLKDVKDELKQDIIQPIRDDIQIIRANMGSN